MAYLRSCGTSNCLTDSVVFFSSGLVGIGWTWPQNLKYLFLKTYPLTWVQSGWLFSVHTVTPFITAGWGGCRGGEGRVRVWRLRQALPPSAWPCTSHSSSLQSEELPGGSQLGAVLLFFSLLELSEAWGTYCADICVGGGWRTVVLMDAWNRYKDSGCHSPCKAASPHSCDC